MMNTRIQRCDRPMYHTGWYHDVSRTSTVLLTVIDRVRTTSIVLVLFRCGVVVEQRANTAFWSLSDFF